MQSRNFKLAIVAANKRHFEVAVEANEFIAPEGRLSEHDITRIVTNRKVPSVEQAAALARVLRRTVLELFPEVRA